jgi:hypothetical protein
VDRCGQITAATTTVKNAFCSRCGFGCWWFHSLLVLSIRFFTFLITLSSTAQSSSIVKSYLVWTLSPFNRIDSHLLIWLTCLILRLHRLIVLHHFLLLHNCTLMIHFLAIYTLNPILITIYSIWNLAENTITMFFY